MGSTDRQPFIKVSIHNLTYMAVENLDASIIVPFLIGLLVSTIVIYVVTLFMRQRRSVKLALLAAIIGSIVYVIAYTRLQDPLLSAILGGIAWLLALRVIYRMGWLKALVVAVVIWIIAYVIDGFLPTAIGPL
jgi:hypothetical protein